MPHKSSIPKSCSSSSRFPCNKDSSAAKNNDKSKNQSINSAVNENVLKKPQSEKIKKIKTSKMDSFDKHDDKNKELASKLSEYQKNHIKSNTLPKNHVKSNTLPKYENKIRSLKLSPNLRINLPFRKSNKQKYQAFGSKNVTHTGTTDEITFGTSEYDNQIDLKDDEQQDEQSPRTISGNTSPLIKQEKHKSFPEEKINRKNNPGKLKTFFGLAFKNTKVNTTSSDCFEDNNNTPKLAPKCTPDDKSEKNRFASKICMSNRYSRLN